MKIKIWKDTSLVIRKSMVPDKEPFGFHSYRSWKDGLFQIGFFSTLIYTVKGGDF